MNPRVVTEPLNGNPLARAAAENTLPPGWFVARPRDADGWRERVTNVRDGHPKDWLDTLSDAIAASGRAAQRLRKAAAGRGVVVTTGQQPGLFGGPVYTLSKALSTLALADELEQATGIPVAPVFWAATDDADFREASSTAVAVSGGAQMIRIDHAAPLGRSMAEMPLGDVSAELEALARAAGSVTEREPLELLYRSYAGDATIGSAYVSFLRALLEPLGVAVIDAWHPATRRAARPLLVAALERSEAISTAVAARNSEIERAGHTPQVQDVPGLSLVFAAGNGGRRRVPIGGPKRPGAEQLGPNVLLRPVVERALLPTVTYVGGPAEIAYFAQVGPIADTLELSQPVIVPRWSCTIIEPHVDRILEKLYLLPEDLRDPHEVERRVARSQLPKSLLTELATTRAFLNERLDALTDVVERERAPVAPSVTGGLRANLMRRLERYERRLLAAAKREHADIMHEIGTARGSLFPLGKPQERALAFVPLLARYGSNLRNDMLREARAHAAMLAGTPAPGEGETVSAAPAGRAR